MTIGPEPIRQTDSMSGRLGNGSQLLDPLGDDRCTVMRPRARFGVELRRARAQLRVVEALDGAVVQRGVGNALAVPRGDREAMVLRRDQNAASRVVDDRVVCAAMSERKLEGLASGRQREQ